MTRYFLPLLVISLMSTSLRADDWPQFLGPRRDGSSLDKGLVAAFPKDGPPTVWQRDVGEGFSGPISAGERMILFHRVGDEEVVECLNAATGKGMWKFAYATNYQDTYGKGNGPRSTPTISGDKVVTVGADGAIHCLTLDAGKKLWSRSLSTEYKAPLGFFGIGPSPLIEQNLVLINAGAKQAGIIAFDLDSGKEVWKATNDPASYSSPAIATVNGQRLAVFFTRTGAVVLEPKSGKVVHQQRFRSRNELSVNAATPLIIDNQAFFTSSYETGALLLKLKKDGADEVWTDETIMSSQYNTSVYQNGHLFGFDGRVDSRTLATFRCVELKTKKVKWDQAEFGNGSMILADGKLIVLTEKGDLCLAEANSAAYRELGRVHLFDKGPCRAQIALANGRLYARDQQKLICVDLRK